MIFGRATKTIRSAVAVLAMLAASPASAWFDMGHMIIAAVAWAQLQPAAREKIAALLKLNPDYPAWTAGVAEERRDGIAFVHAATWADDIKRRSNYQLGSIAQDGADAAANAGYSDHLAHPYWHYYDLPLSADGAATAPPAAPNALTQIKTFAAALASDAPDDVKSYDLVWLEHLVGDAHQPLHAVSRFSRGWPQGDRGGNAEKICRALTCGLKLHAFWDSALGDRGNAEDAIAAAAALAPPNPARAAMDDPAVWFDESAALARESVYTPAVGDGAGPFTLDQDYQDQAARIARVQAAVAGARLARLLNAAFR